MGIRLMEGGTLDFRGILERGAMVLALAAAVAFCQFVRDASLADEKARSMIAMAIGAAGGPGERLSGTALVDTLKGAQALVLYRDRSAWHGGAAEALGWATAELAKANNDASFLAEAGRYSVEAIRLNPVNPAAWLRLAAIRLDGGDVALCADAATCLARSWLTAPMGLPQSGLACERLQLAIAARDLQTADDYRVSIFLAGGPSLEVAARCLAGLSREDVFRALLRRPR